MSLEDAFAPAEAEYRAAVLEETWGHLRPPRDDHRGTIVAAHGEYGDVVVVQRRFDGVEDSPWFFEAMMQFVQSAIWGPETDVVTNRRSHGIWEFRGFLRVYKNGHCSFHGKWTKMDLYPGRIPATKPRRPWGRFITGEPAQKDLMESDRDHMGNNRSACVRFLDTMNERRRSR